MLFPEHPPQPQPQPPAPPFPADDDPPSPVQCRRLARGAVPYHIAVQLEALAEEYERHRPE